MSSDSKFHSICLCTLIIFYFFVHVNGSSHHDGFHKTLKHLRSKSSAAVQANAARDLAVRLLGNRANLFSFKVNPNLGPQGKDTFQLIKLSDSLIEITGTTGVAAAWGLHYYLKHYCNAHIAWEGSQLELAPTLPGVNITITSNDRFRYYQNVCTVGYSSVWWQWEQWEKNIDWMALNGINLALAFQAEEAIWKRIYLEFGLTHEEIDQHFGGPAFLPWSRMGNIRGWGGPLTDSWHDQSIRLQHLILDRMRELGIVPVLPAFAGHVPRAFAKLFSSTNMTKVQPWNDFNDTFCCPLLIEPTDPLFQIVGEKFLTEYIKEFGTNHIYNCDTFNEMEPSKNDLSYLRDAGASVYSAMIRADPDAIWLMQGWLFVNEFYFWTPPRVKALLTSVPIGKMIVLDLQSEQFPRYEIFDSYCGQPFIWCMLHNFGGTLGMFGSASIINHRIFHARKMPNSTMIGTGLTPEGINQNYVIYDLALEMAYRKKPVHLSTWFENYAARRYGVWNEYAVTAWRKLGLSVYDFVGVERIRGHYAITGSPSLKINTVTWYEPKTLFAAWDSLLNARHGRKNNTLYQYDVVDLTRQVLQLTGDIYYPKIIEGFKKKNVSAIRYYGKSFLDLFDDLESILASSKHFLLGSWIKDARALGKSHKEKENYEYNAKNQITLWGPNGEIKDYANKQWSGVMKDYFQARWGKFLNAMETAVREKSKFDEKEVKSSIFQNVEKPFSTSNKVYPHQPIGDSIDIALKINSRWHEVNDRDMGKRKP